MTRKGKVDGFPPEIRLLIQSKLYERGFKDYAGLVDELARNGISVSKSTLHRFGRKFEAQVKHAEIDKLTGRT